MKTKTETKPKSETKLKTEVPNPPAEFKVWCEECRIRIAPFDERTIMNGKTYHSRCYAKIAPVTVAKTKRAGR